MTIKKRFIIYTLFVGAVFGTSTSLKSQEQKKPSERSFSQEISKIKQIQKERTKLIEQTKSQTTENTILPGGGSAPVKTETKNPTTVESTPAIKPSSGEMRKPQKARSSKG
jgi:c-di-GMP-binding flagellar brake protein YcgR